MQLLFLGRALLVPAQVSLDCMTFASLEISTLLTDRSVLVIRRIKSEDVSRLLQNLPILYGCDHGGRFHWYIPLLAFEGVPARVS